MNTTVDNPTRIVVLGGGYGGVIAARKLAHHTQRSNVEITLINASATFVERIRLHQFAANQNLRQHPMTRMLAGTGVNFVQGWITELTPASKAVNVKTQDDLQAFNYDYLIYALGSHIDMTQIPGVADYAYNVGVHGTAAKLRMKLPGIAAFGGKVVVCGGGLTAIETATELAETYPRLRVTLITDGRFGAFLSRKGQRHVRNAFYRLHIEVTDYAAVSRVTPNLVSYQGGELDFDVCIWAGGMVAPTLARESGLAVNGQGQIVVDEHLRSVSNPTIYAIGDAASPSEAIHNDVIMGCKTALPMGAHAAEEIAARLQNKPHREFDFAYTVACISLGRRDGLIQMLDAENHPKEQIISGWLGARIKETICRFAIWQILADRWFLYTRRSAGLRHAQTSVKAIRAQ